MSEPLIERLSRFTPAASGLDRDALLFAAGRGSARPNRGWMLLSGFLATTQLVALGLFLPQAAGWNRSSAGAIAVRPTPPLASSRTEPDAVADPRIWTVRHDLDEVRLQERLGESLVLSDTEPVLRAFGDPQSAAVN
ncbi:MAG TPA: hypothetical protein VHC22_10750 [Pirellulales bacterium]|nr:hypothetical protein [Pirellulales bacterium]